MASCYCADQNQESVGSISLDAFGSTGVSGVVADNTLVIKEGGSPGRSPRRGGESFCSAAQTAATAYNSSDGQIWVSTVTRERRSGSVSPIWAQEHPVVSPPLDIVNLAALMERTAGRSDIIVGLIDGPIVADHADLATSSIRRVLTASDEADAVTHNSAREHGTYVAGILSGRRGSPAPSICPGCTLLARSIFLKLEADAGEMPSATPDELADAIVESVDLGARILNMSIAVAQPSPNHEPRLEEALNHAASRSVIVVAAAGNQGTLGSSAITRHPWVIPVVGCDSRGQPLAMSNLGSSIGRRGLMAPGDHVTSLGADGQPVTSSGTSAAAPFVTGAIALLWSQFPEASAVEVKSAVTRPHMRRATVVPPVLDAWTGYHHLLNLSGHGD